MRIHAAFLVSALLLAAGCGGVVSDAPLSGPDDAALDDRLIGWWEEAPPAGDPAKPAHRLVVGRSTSDAHGLELVIATLDKAQRVEVQRFRIETTRLDDRWHLSFSGERGEDFLLARYALDGDALIVDALDEARVAAAIEAGEIAGRVKRNPRHTGPGSAEPAFDEVRLTAATEALRTWLRTAPVWAARTVTYHRIALPIPERER